MKTRVVTGGRSVLNLDTIYGVTTSAANVVAAHDGRASFSLQNIGTTKVYVRFGAAPILGGSKYFSFILPPASGDEEGDGGTLTVDNYQGDVYVVTASGTSTIISTEFIR